MAKSPPFYGGLGESYTVHKESDREVLILQLGEERPPTASTKRAEGAGEEETLLVEVFSPGLETPPQSGRSNQRWRAGLETPVPLL
jgi:hypothetical protein